VNDVRKLGLSVGIPPKFAGTIEAVGDVTADPAASLFIAGPVGTGKTYMACTLIYKLLSGWVSAEPLATQLPKVVRFINAAEFLLTVRTDLDNVDKYLSWLSGMDYLFLDDLGAGKATEYGNDCLYYVVNKRYDNNRHLTLTTNLTASELAKLCGERTVDRLMEMTTSLKLTGPSRRARKEG
jgi:DNA replication protein DnaC